MSGRRRALVLSYDGAGYRGWQIQPQGPTVQGVVEEALLATLGEPVRVVGAGRTDAGVHALGQVAHFTDPRGWPAERLAGALRTRMPPEVRVRAVFDPPEGFHALSSARDKTYVYQYHLSRVAGGAAAREAAMSPWRRRTFHPIPAGVDVTAMRAAAACLVGRHDFTALSKVMPVGRETTKTVVAVRLLRGPACLRLVVTGEGFLYGMVRLMAGLLLDVGTGRHLPEDVDALLAARRRGEVSASLPARALFLWRVRYPVGAGPGRLLC